MSGVSDAVARAGRVSFELDRFAIADDELCVVEGSWSGVRGRRFMRPSLTVTIGGSETRLLADLADKPWAAEDGEPWKATFPVALEVADIERAELTVAPDITIALRGSPDASDRPKPKRAGRRTQPPRSRTRSTGPDASERRIRELGRELERVKSDKAQVAARLDELLDQLSEVARERDEISGQRSQLMAERDEMAAELEALRRAGEEAAAAREAVRLDHERALAERDAAIAAQRGAASDRDLAVAECERAIAERDGAFALRDHALAERDAAAAARDETIHQRDALSRTSERLQSELAEVSSTRGAALVMRRAVQERSRSRRSPLLGPVAMAILVLLAAVVVLIVTRAL
jgi:hypothetical protein